MAKFEKRSFSGTGEQPSEQFRSGASAALTAALVAGALAAGSLVTTGCSGSGDPASANSNNNGTAGNGQVNSAGGSSALGTGGAASGVNGGTGGLPLDINRPDLDPGRVGLHRLNNQEYNNTVRDLLGDTTAPASGFLAEEGVSGFDNTASALGMTGPQFEKYFNTAGTLVDAAFANAAWMAANITCTPSAASDPCATTVLDTLGLHIYRRPLNDAEKAAALKVYNDDFARASDGMAALKEMVCAMMSSANFLYRVEIPTDPASLTPQALNPYEMASRLSYLHWSTLPDDTLFQAAAAGELLDPAKLEAQVDRMLLDAKSDEFLNNFGGQWLDYRKLITHSVTGTLFPTYTEELRAAMTTEGKLWFKEFVQNDHLLTDWFTGDFNFVNGALAAHYGYTLPAGADPAAFTRVENPGDARVGFMGLGHYLTNSSFPGRTTPTKRAVWILENLMCSPPPQPPPNVPKLEATAEPNSQAVDPATIVNVKARLEAHRQNPMCNACHQTLDPIGLALENFDAIGAYRTAYSNGDVIDASGTFGVHAADGTVTPQPFTDVPSLAALLATDSRFTPCVAKQVFSYAVGRAAGASDDPYLAEINDRWAERGGLTIRNLLKTVVVNDTFRFSRGEAP